MMRIAGILLRSIGLAILLATVLLATVMYAFIGYIEINESWWGATIGGALGLAGTWAMWKGYE